MKQSWYLLVCSALLISNSLAGSIQPTQEWITILVHGIFGFGANFCPRTIFLAKYDELEGSTYYNQVSLMREHTYLSTIQPTGKLGLHPVQKPTDLPDAAYAFSVLYTDMSNRYLGPEKNTFYTFGWSGLISEKRRRSEARQFYRELKQLIKDRSQQGTIPKIRLIGYSHGATMFLNFANLRATEFCEDTFLIDETYLLGTPINNLVGKRLAQEPFKKVYNIYSKSDKVQPLDIFTGGNPFSQWALLGCTPRNLTQIELRITAPFHALDGKTYPTSMRGVRDQSPGHVELWSFGWTRTLYRKTVRWYPMAGGVFIPYLVHAARSLESNHVKVDIRLLEEQALVSEYCGLQTTDVPFMTEKQFTDFVYKALCFHPNNTAYLEKFLKLQESVPFDAYK